MSGNDPAPPTPPPLPPPVAQRSRSDGTRAVQPLWISVFVLTALCGLLALASFAAVAILVLRPSADRVIADASDNSPSPVADAAAAETATATENPSQPRQQPKPKELPTFSRGFPASTLSPLAEPVTAAYVVFRSDGDAYAFFDHVKNFGGRDITWLSGQEVRKRREAAGIGPNFKLADPWQRAQFIQALRTDYLLIVHGAEAREDLPLDIEICEGKFGASIARQTVPIKSDTTAADAAGLGNLLTTIVRQRAGAAATYYTIAPFRVAGNSGQMNADCWPEALAELALVCLPVRSGIAYVPLDYSSDVEKVLAGEGLPALKTYTGEYTNSGKDGFQLVLRLEQGGRELGKVSQRFKARDDLVVALASLLEKLRHPGPVLMPGIRESVSCSRLLAYRARRDMNSGSPARAFAALEAAVVADPNSANLRLQCLEGYVSVSDWQRQSAPVYTLRAVGHLEQYLALGGEEKAEVPGQSRRQTALDMINKTRNLSLLARRGESSYGGGWTLEQNEQVDAALERIIDRRVAAGGDASLYVEWLLNDSAVPKKLQRLGDLAERVKDLPQGGSQVAKWLESKQFPNDLKNQAVWREFLARVARINSPSMLSLAANLRGQLPGDEVEVLAALVKKREVRFDDQVNEANVAGKRLQFSQWSRQDGRTAELAPMRIIGPLVEFCTREGDLYELPTSELSDSDRARLTSWQRQQEREP